MTSKIMQMALKQVAKQPITNYFNHSNQNLRFVWGHIRPHLTVRVDITEQKGMIRVERNNTVIFIAQKKTMFRIKSRLDWVHYEPNDLATNINNDTIEHYYFTQLNDPNSYPNDWARLQEEYDMKTYYANRVGRQIDHIDNI